MHANPLAVHGLQFGLDRKDEHLDIGQDVPAVTAAGAGTGRAEGGGRSAGLERLACDIGVIWCGGADALPYVPGPT
jgi:hypothetical protein